VSWAFQTAPPTSVSGKSWLVSDIMTTTYAMEISVRKPGESGREPNAFPF